MALSLQECIEKIKEIHPDLYPVWWIEYKGQYLFNLLKRGASKEEASVNFYAIDPESGQVSGSIPPLSVYDNPVLHYIYWSNNLPVICLKSPKTPGKHFYHCIYWSDFTLSAPALGTTCPGTLGALATHGGVVSYWT